MNSSPNDAQLEEYRRQLDRNYHEIAVDQTKQLLTLSSSSIALSIAFAGAKINAGKTLLCKELFAISWVLWVFCIILVMLSMYISQQAHLDLSNRIYAGTFKYDDPDSCWTRSLPIINGVTLAMFIAASIIFLFAVFGNF